MSRRPRPDWMGAELGYENDWANYGTAHRAVDDAIAQALTLSNVINKLRTN